MEQLSSIDANFVLVESPHLPMHISSVSIYDPSTAPGGKVRFKDIMQLYQDAIYEVPFLRRRLVRVPGDMDYPYWIEDPDFDIEFHVRHIALPAPGDWRQFFIQLARLHARRLDLGRPLWEIYVIEGLNKLDGIPKGSFALVQKFHHAAMDGAATAKLFAFLNTNTPKTIKRRHGSMDPVIREHKPSALPLLLRSYQRYAVRPAKLAKVMYKGLAGLRRIKDAEKRGDIVAAIEPSPSIFNRQVSPHRTVTAASFELDEFRQLRHAVPGATLNDLALSVCGGAINRYLKLRGEALDPPLVAQLPVNIRETASHGEDGNAITTMNISCGSDIDGPIERLEAVHRATVAGKKRLELLDPGLMEEAADAFGPHLSMALYNLIYNPAAVGPLSKLVPDGPSFVFSNVPGPSKPVYFCGAEFKWGTGLGPLTANMGLFITATSAVNQFIFSATACRTMLPDPEVFRDCLEESYAETRQAARKILANRRSPKTGRSTA